MRAKPLSFEDEQVILSWLTHYDRYLFGLRDTKAKHAASRFHTENPGLSRSIITGRTLRRYARQEGVCRYWTLGGRIRRGTHRHAYEGDEWRRMNVWMIDHANEIDPDLSTIGFVHKLGRYHGLIWSRHAVIECLRVVLHMSLGNEPRRVWSYENAKISVQPACNEPQATVYS